MAPSSDCEGPIVSAHTLSVEAMLRPIARDGHVYANKCNLYSCNEEGVVRLELQGIKKTSVFNGFCQKHDRELFKPIETVPFICTPEQCFLHAFRAAAKECYLKPRQAASMPTPEQIREVHGIPNEIPMELSPVGLIFLEASRRGAEDVKKTKAQLDKIYLAQEWRRLCTTVIEFSNRPSLVCNFIYFPDFDFDGNRLQNLGDTRADMETLMVSIISGETGGFALLSYLDTASVAPKKLIDSLTSQKDITSALFWLPLASRQRNTWLLARFGGRTS